MVSLLDGGAVVRVQTWDARAVPAEPLQSVTGGAWPLSAGGCARDRVDIICVGPGDWLLLTGIEAHAALLRDLQAACAGTVFRATDVSAALSRIRVEGPQTRQLLSQACAVDLHPDVFGAGRATRTRFAGMAVILRCLQPTQFECIVTRSLGQYCRAWLERAARGG